MKKVIVILFLTVAASSFALPINRAHIPATASWLVHIDFDAVRDSEMGALIAQEITRQHQKQIEGLTTLLGTDLMEDLHGATLYGPNASEEEAVLLAYAKYDKEKLLALLGMSQGYAEDNHKGTTLYHWVDEKRQRDQVGAFAADGMIVISQTQDAVTTVLDLLAGEQGRSLASDADNPLAGLCQLPDSVMVIAVADGLMELTQQNEHAAILQNSKMAAAIMSEKDGTMKLNVDLVAESAEAATKIEQVVLGMQAFLNLTQKQNPEVAPLLGATTLQRVENQLKLTFQYPSARLFEIIKKHQDIKIELPTIEGQ